MPPRGGGKKSDLRACLVCSILQTPADFLAGGCPNCEDILEVSRLTAVSNPCSLARDISAAALVRETDNMAGQS
jgi:hypothetical protein